MSTLAYGALTRKRELAQRSAMASTAPYGLGIWFDSVAAIVPAEILIAQAAILSLTSVKSRELPTGNTVVTITDPGTLRLAFFGLIVASIILYVASHLFPTGLAQWHRADWLRVLIAPLAFIGWNLAQRGSAIDAIMPEIGDTMRYVGAVVAGLVLLGGAALLAWQASGKPTADLPIGRSPVDAQRSQSLPG